MRISKIKIKNLFGITEFEASGKSMELAGKNGAGKSSVIDAIRYALTNKSGRDYIVRNGETEGEIIIETDTGLRINRKKRTDQADYKSIKSGGHEVGSPEAFLRDIFTPLQLNPVEFMQMPPKRQNAMILDMIEYDWDLNKIKEWFGEIPGWVAYDQNILQVLDDIQSENGKYFQERQDINRDARNKRAFIADIKESIPVGYDAEKWEAANVGDVYRKIEQIRRENDLIDKAHRLIDSRANKVRKFEADREIEKSAIEQEFSHKETMLREQIASLEEQARSKRKELSGLAEKKKDKIELVERSYRANIAEYDALLEENKQYADLKKKSTEALEREAEEIESMQRHLNEYRRLGYMEAELKELVAESNELTRKIEKARSLPGEILATSTIPIKGLTVKNGIPLINGLPISNLSDGEKLDLCIDVTLQKPSGLQIILIDGVEKLSTALREKLYKKCKEKGLQFIATRTTDDDTLTVIEL